MRATVHVAYNYTCTIHGVGAFSSAPIISSTSETLSLYSTDLPSVRIRFCKSNPQVAWNGSANLQCSHTCTCNINSAVANNIQYRSDARYNECVYETHSPPRVNAFTLTCKHFYP